MTTKKYHPSCGWEGPRGGGCSRRRTHVVSAGDPKGVFFSSFSCEEHLEEIQVEAFRVTKLIPTILTDAEFEERAAKLRAARGSI